MAYSLFSQSLFTQSLTLHTKSLARATQRYVDRYIEIYGDLQPEDYVCEVASTVAEAKKLVEAGFEYVCKINEEQLFRKVK